MARAGPRSALGQEKGRYQGRFTGGSRRFHEFPAGRAAVTI
ncbi:hypothetical protein [Actinacidiphila glaucinigra]